MQTKVIGGSGPNVFHTGAEQAVDPFFQAARVALRPLDYSGVGTVYGHYAVAQKSGATVSIGALGHVARLRWSPTMSNLYCVLLKLRIGWIVTGAVTAATPMDFDASIARAFTVDYSTNISLVNLATAVNTNQMRGSMAPSQMGASGPGICTTSAISGQSLVLDNAPFAITTFANQPSGNGTVTQAVGVGAPMQTLYDVTSAGQHPVVLGNNEGIVVREVTAGVTSGSVAIYCEWTWCECLVF